MDPDALPDTGLMPYHDASPSESPVPAISMPPIALTHGLAVGPQTSEAPAAFAPATSPCFTADEPSWLIVGPGATADWHCTMSPAR